MNTQYITKEGTITGTCALVTPSYYRTAKGDCYVYVHFEQPPMDLVEAIEEKLGRTRKDVYSPLRYHDDGSVTIKFISNRQGTGRGVPVYDTKGKRLNDIDDADLSDGGKISLACRVYSYKTDELSSVYVKINAVRVSALRPNPWETK